MELENRTRYPAGLARMAYGGDRVAASVLVRVTYDLKNGRLTPSEEQPWIVSNQPWSSPRGWMPGDLVFYKGGVDLFLFGHATPEDGKPAKQMEVVVTLGSTFRRRAHVSGARVWHRRLGQLVPTPPQPFASLPLTLHYAYGGADTWDGLAIPWPDNPEGIGFYLEEKNAVDRPLPCIEEPEQLIQKWDDRPPAAGFCALPATSSMRARHGLTEGPPPSLKRVPRMFNAAFPPMIAPHAHPGDPFTVTGVSRNGPLHFTLPAPQLLVRLAFGGEVHEEAPAIDEVGVDVDKQTAFIAYRYPFRYVVHEMQARSCELLERPKLERSPWMPA